MRPDFPTPNTTTRPVQLAINRTDSKKSLPRDRFWAATVAASKRRTSAARRRIDPLTCIGGRSSRMEPRRNVVGKMSDVGLEPRPHEEKNHNQDGINRQ